jgi:chloramphenicol O-acetyltransferase type A
MTMNYTKSGAGAAMERIDFNTWDRREHFEYFRHVDFPQFNICADIDISRFLAAIKADEISFYLAMVFAVTATANRLPNFRYRIRNGEVWLHDRVHPSFTYLDKASGLFKYVTVEAGDELREFVARAGEKAERQQGLFGDPDEEKRDDLLYLTSIPWVSFTGLSHTVTLDKDDAVPRISWGKYRTENGKTLMPLSVQVNHAVADGYHVGQYFIGLQEYLDKACL